MTARQIYGGLAPTFQLPASAGTAGQYIQSTGEGTTVWAAGGGGGGGSGTVTSVAAGPYCEVSGTPTIAPVIGLNITPAGAVGTNGQVLAATATANELAWVDRSAALTFSLPLLDTASVISLPIAGTWSPTNNTVQGSSATALEWGHDATGPALTFSLPLLDTAGVVSLPIAGTWSTTNNTLQGSSATALEWGPDATGVSQVKPGTNISIGGGMTAPTVNVVVTGTYAANNVVGSTDGGTTMKWVENPADGVASIAPGTNTLVTGSASVPQVNVHILGAYAANDIVGSTDNGASLAWITPAAGTIYTGTAPIDITGSDISIGLSNYFEKNGADELDLKVTAAPVDGQILSANAGSLTWVNQPPTLSALLPVAINSGVISLPISGSWSTSNNVVKSSAANALVWGTDGSGGSGTVTSVIAAYPLEVASGTSTTTPTISLGYNNSFDLDSNNALALNTTNPPVNGYLLSAVGTDGHLNWIEPPAGTGTVTSVTATADGYCAIAGTPTTAPTVGLNVAAVGTSGQYLTASGVAGQLAFINPPASGTGTVTRVSANNYCAISGIATTTPTVGLSLSPPGSVGTAGQLLSVSSVTDALTFVNPTVTSAGFGLNITSGVIAMNVSGTPANNDVPAFNSVSGGLTWQPPPSGGIATVITNIITKPVWSVSCSPTGQINVTQSNLTNTTTLGNMSIYNTDSLILTCITSLPVGGTITLNTPNFLLVPPMLTTTPSQDQPSFTGILYNITSGYNLVGSWQINSSGGAEWDMADNMANLNPPVAGDVLYLSITPFAYLNA